MPGRTKSGTGRFLPSVEFLSEDEEDAAYEWLWFVWDKVLHRAGKLTKAGVLRAAWRAYGLRVLPEERPRRSHRCPHCGRLKRVPYCGQCDVQLQEEDDNGVG